jgi:hypothetical protein
MVNPGGSKTVAVNTYWWVVVMSLLVIGHLTGVMNFFHFSSGTPCTIFVEIWLVRWGTLSASDCSTESVIFCLF